MPKQKVGPREAALRASREAEFKRKKKAKKHGVKQPPLRVCPECGQKLNPARAL